MPEPVTATRVPENRRLRALPNHFGRHMMLVESKVFDHIRLLDKDYTGGFWDFYELSNGGFFMRPAGEKQHAIGRADIGWPENGYTGTMSSEAAGITACLFALCDVSARVPDPDRIADHFHLLRDYAADHAEAGEIFAAID